MKRYFSLLIIGLFLSISIAQSQNDSMSKTPYESIGSYPEVVTPATVLARTIDGLGYRYYWATEGLTDEDLIFRPSADASNVIETLEHLHGLTEGILNCVSGKPNIRPQIKIEPSYEEMRHQSLVNLKKATNENPVNPKMNVFMGKNRE